MNQKRYETLISCKNILFPNKCLRIFNMMIFEKCKWGQRSIVANFFMKSICPFMRCYDHLAQDGFLFFEVGELLLEMIVFLLLVGHAQL